MPPAQNPQAGTGYLTTPTLAVGADAADRRALADLRDVQQACGLTVEPLTVREARAREPLLSPGISCAFDIPADHQVDPRLLIARLTELLGADGRSSFVRRRAAGLLWAGRPRCGGPACGRRFRTRRGNRGGQRARRRRAR